VDPTMAWKLACAWAAVHAVSAYSPVDEATFDVGAVETRESVTDGFILTVDYFYKQRPISPWHDLPFSTRGNGGEELLTFVCEIPLGAREKVEIHKSAKFNSLRQDLHKDGSLRYYVYSDSIVNYGAISQTWEDPDFLDPDTHLGGDNDPVDVLQLTMMPCVRGQVQRVRVLGALALVDGGETDWKLLVVDADAGDAASKWRDVGDVPVARVNAVRDWFRLYKTAEGKPENEYGLGGRAVDREHAMRVAHQTHAHWRHFVDGQKPCDFDKNGPCWVSAPARLF